MKARYEEDLQMIEKLFQLKNEVEVPARLFNELLNTYPPAMREKFRAEGIEHKEGKFIKKSKYL